MENEKLNHCDSRSKIKEKANLILSDTFDNEKFSVRESQSEDDINEIRKKLATQSQAISEFENYLEILLNIVKGSPLGGYSDKIKKGLEKVDYLYRDNVDLKRNIIKEIKKGEESAKQIEHLKIQIKNKMEEGKNKELGKLIMEKKDLLESISTISEELDNFSEKNNILIDILKCKNEKEEVAKLKEEMKILKLENKSLKDRIISGDNEKRIKFGKRTYRGESKGKNIFSCFNKDKEDRYTINFNKMK